MSTHVMPRAGIATLRFPDKTSAAGLFVAWRATPKDGATDPAPFSLAFCGKLGTLHAITVPNPWVLALDSSRSLGATLKAPPQLFEDQDYDLVLISHPSPLVAKALLERLNKGEPVNGSGGSQQFPIIKVRPTAEKGNFVVELPTTSDQYVPKGHPDLKGFVLYRHMPYAALADVKAAVQKLAFHLGELRFPTNVVKEIPPYPSSESSHTGVFDEAVQGATHTFVTSVLAGVAFQLSPAGIAGRGNGQTEKETWAFLHGTPTANVSRQLLTEPEAAPLEVGVVDEQFFAEVLAWKQNGLRRQGDISVAQVIGELTFFGQPEMWLGFRGLDLTLKALGVPYRLKLSNSSRQLPAKGPGQVETSFHKIGRALDLDMFFAEPKADLPFGFEGNWPTSSDLRWQVYVHSSLDPFTETPPISADLAAAREKFSADLTALLGDELPLVAKSFVFRLEQLHNKLVALAGSGQLASEFFRQTIQRFQFQAGEPDGGQFMPAITAAADATANGLAGDLRSWVNMSRLAFGLGLRGIGAHTKKLGVISPINFRDATAAGKKNRVAKAIALDEIAEGIRVAGQQGVATITVTPPGGAAQEIPTSAFRADAIRSWVRRPSDDPNAAPPPPREVTYSDAGADMTVEWPVGKTKATNEILSFLNARAAIEVLVVQIGAGLTFSPQAPLATGQTLALGDVRAALEQATASNVKADRKVTVRPVYAATFPAGDPGTFTYRIVAMNVPSELEWWHFERQPVVDTLFWDEYAALWGLDGTVLTAPNVPKKDAVPPQTPWMGGADMKRSQFPARLGTEPTNKPGKEPP